MRCCFILVVGLAVGCAVDGARFTPPPDGAPDDAAVGGPDAPIDARPDAPPDAPIDAAPDAPTDAAPDAPMGPTLVAAAVPLRVAVGDTATVTLTVSGRPSSTVTWSITPSGGTFTPASGAVATSSAGVAVIATTFTAAAAGDHGQLVTLIDGGSTAAPFELRARTLRRLGEVAPFPDTQGLAIAANALVGQSVVLDRDAVIMRLGVIAQTGGFNGRMALYANAGSAPRALVAATAVAPITGVAQELPVATPFAVSAGTYWVMAAFDAAAPIKRSTTNTTLAFVAHPLAQPPPDPIATAAVTNRVLNYYVVVAD